MIASKFRWEDIYLVDFKHGHPFGDEPRSQRLLYAGNHQGTDSSHAQHHADLSCEEKAGNCSRFVLWIDCGLNSDEDCTLNDTASETTRSC